MKGQFSIEYYISLILFILFITYIFFQLFRFTPVYTNEMESQRIKSEAYQLSELLINDLGEPADWNTLIGTANENDIKRIGLSSIRNKTNLLSLSKIAAINSSCTDQEKIRKWLDTEYQFSIIVTDKVNSEILTPNCIYPETSGKFTIINISRVVAFDSGSYGELIFELM